MIKCQRFLDNFSLSNDRSFGLKVYISASGLFLSNILPLYPLRNGLETQDSMYTFLAWSGLKPEWHELQLLGGEPIKSLKSLGEPITAHMCWKMFLKFRVGAWFGVAPHAYLKEKG